MTVNEAFHANRLTGIGGSDAATVCGLNPYKSAVELYYEKRGESTPEDISDKPAIRWGNLLEPLVAAEYMRETGRVVRRKNAMLRHKEHPHMIAHLDRVVQGERIVVEIKTVSQIAYDKGDWGPAGTDEVPSHYLLQVQHYMAVTGYPVAHLAVLIGGRDFRLYVIERNEALIEHLIERESAFWTCVLEGVLPEVDYTNPLAGADVQRIYPDVTDEVVEIGERGAEIHKQLREIAVSDKENKTAKAALRAELAAMIGQAGFGVLPDGTAYRRKATAEKFVKGYTKKAGIDMRHVKGVR